MHISCTIHVRHLYRFERMLFILPGTNRARWCLRFRIICIILCITVAATSAIRRITTRDADTALHNAVKMPLTISTGLLFAIAFIAEVYCNLRMIQEVFRTSRLIKHSPSNRVEYFRMKLRVLIAAMIVFDALALLDRIYLNLFFVSLVHARGLASLLLLEVIKDGLDNDLRGAHAEVQITVLSSVLPPTDERSWSVKSSPVSNEER